MTEKLNLILLGEPHEVPAEELEPEQSLHTGRSIRRARISFRVPEGDTPAITEAFGKARDAADALVEPDGARWLVTSNSYSYTNNERLHRHTAELREVEVIQAERLEFLGLSLAPAHYEEKAEDEGIVITARFDLDGDEDERLEREIQAERDDPYFEVRRRGVNDEPIRMRFGRCLWQETERGRNHLIWLVSELGDTTERQRRLLLEPEFGHITRKTLVAEATIEELLNALAASGALPETTADAIRERAVESAQANARHLDQVQNLDDHL
jgi:hypothetical protein